MPNYGYGTATHGTAGIGTASAQVIAANPRRNYLLLQNDGTVDVYLRLGTAAAVLNEGVRLSPGGGSYEMSRGAANIYTGAIQGIVSVGTQKVLRLEGT